MPVFKTESREWTVSLCGPSIRDVRDRCAIDPISEDALERLTGDPVLLADVLAVLCRDQIRSVGSMTDDQFRALIRGGVIDKALDAFHEAQLDFSQSDRKEVLRATAAKMRKVREVATARMMERLNSPEFEAKLLDALAKREEAAVEDALTLLSSATSLPELPTSSPAEKPSAS